MKITSFEDIEATGYEVCFIHSGCDGDADIIILDINSIFDYEEKKHDACKDKFTSIAIIDDPTDYDAFKNFGITAWIKREDLSTLPELLNEVKNRMAA
ncbi:MAG: hypothetical protein DRG78_02930 [Epsilonproteobacteria bacterium]|nr:MAG: hypothetical protein DRG78_02930 [Campylobacterota bacterium]